MCVQDNSHLIKITESLPSEYDGDWPQHPGPSLSDFEFDLNVITRRKAVPLIRTGQSKEY